MKSASCVAYSVVALALLAGCAQPLAPTPAAAELEEATPLTVANTVGNLIPFQTYSSGGSKIYLYDMDDHRVVALPGVNGRGSQSNPRLSANQKWLVYQSDAKGSEDIYLFSMSDKLIANLPGLNMAGSDEIHPDITDDGKQIVFVSQGDHGGKKGGYGDDDHDYGYSPYLSGYSEYVFGEQVVVGPGSYGDKHKGFGDKHKDYGYKASGSQLKLYDRRDQGLYTLPIGSHFSKIARPAITCDGDMIAFAASTRGQDKDIYLYQFRGARLLSLPVINSHGDETDPAFDPSGNWLAYVSDQNGSDDIYVLDRKSMNVENLSFNRGRSDEQAPRFTKDGNRLVYQSGNTVYRYSDNSGNTVELIKDAKLQSSY